MLYKKHLIIICSFLIFLSCKEELKISFSEVSPTTKNNSLVEINIPEAIGIEVVTTPINEAIQKTVIASLHIGNMDDLQSKSIEESISLFNKEYNTFKNDFPEAEQPWEAQVDGDIMFQSSEIISIVITSYKDTGAAHGLLNISFLNFETETGKLIQNDKLISNIGAFKTIAQAHYEKALEEKDIVTNAEAFDLPKNIAYSEEGVILLYNLFQTEPYATEIIEFTIPFEEVASYLVFNSL
ncbi:DUF3298 and DUF4163 domain-containing protein [uncultured Algibacter sp.]|uniref:DUF3298 and DUF4163 domain-containing protein n=1 Tax=uncultured Algibacter sp. TaxID=298659 RepID=UPI002616EF76|nr:DUF3298 and DUF4163 domain-containing protein [uncultured Algibacter sp.]